MSRSLKYTIIATAILLLLIALAFAGTLAIGGGNSG